MAPRKDRIRVGFVGCGRIAGLQALGYLDDPRAEIVAVCDRDEALAHARAREWNAARACTDIADLLRDDTVDAVEIALPHHLHRDVAIAALEAGKHVSLQKPPTLTLGELDDVDAVARKHGLTVRVFENFQHYAPHVRARQLIAEGAIGDPLSVRLQTVAGRPQDGWEVPASSQRWRMNPDLCGGGPTCFDHGYHCFNMGRFFIPAPVERVHAWIHVNRFADDAVYDGPALISWKYAGAPRFGSWEVVASLGMKLRSKYYAAEDRTEIHGSEGILWINRCTSRLLDEPALVLYRDGETRAWHDLADDWADSFRAAGRAFVDALLDGTPAPQGLADARETLRFAIAANLSAREGRDVLLSEVGSQTRATLPAG